MNIKIKTLDIVITTKAIVCYDVIDTDMYFPQVMKDQIVPLLWELLPLLGTFLTTDYVTS